jgi:hypothetical protein
MDVMEKKMYYLLDQLCGAVVDDGKIVEFRTEEEAERWAEANMRSWQVMEGSLRESDIYRSERRI